MRMLDGEVDKISFSAGVDSMTKACANATLGNKFITYIHNMNKPIRLVNR
jgi:hypothetical protein